MDFFNVNSLLLTNIGIFIALGIIFAESGLLIGFFFPGDSMLFTAGIIASQGHFNVWYFILGGIIAAIAGLEVGYEFGKRVGPRIFTKEDSLLFHKDHIRKAQEYYAKYGSATLILARFTPVVRTFAPILAGVGDMDRKRFTLYNIIGAALWIPSITLLGYFLGKRVANIDNYILPILAVIIIGSLIPTVIGIVRSRRKKH